MFHVYWPALACLTLILIVGVIMVMLRHGGRLCKLRHETFAEERLWWGRTYEQPVPA